MNAPHKSVLWFWGITAIILFLSSVEIEFFDGKISGLRFLFDTRDMFYAVQTGSERFGDLLSSSPILFMINAPWILFSVFLFRRGIFFRRNPADILTNSFPWLLLLIIIIIPFSIPPERSSMADPLYSWEEQFNRVGLIEKIHSGWRIFALVTFIIFLGHLVRKIVMQIKSRATA